MKILVTGGNGQLGSSIKYLAPNYPALEFVFIDIEELDLTNKEDTETYFKPNKFDYVVNCAAYTAVDNAEKEKEKAEMVNVEAVRNLVHQVNSSGSTLIHISTDYVYSGLNHKPYDENDPTSPASEYGKTKEAGEVIVKEQCTKGIILRTSWLYSEYGNNFLKTILRLADNNPELKIIADQVGTPTYAGDLAKGIVHLIEKGYTDASVFNFSNEGVASWYDFAWSIVKMSDKKCRVIPIKTEEYPLPAPRPYYSVMSKKKFTSTFDYNIPHWLQSLKTCLSNL